MTTSTTTRRDYYAEITNKVLAKLESGVAPWHQSWTVVGRRARNLDTNKAYRGINVLLLAMGADEGGYTSPFWATFKQVQGRGGRVKKGEHGTMIVFFQKILVDDKENPGEKKVLPVLRHYFVFNLEQVDTEGMRLPKWVTEYDAAKDKADTTPVEAAEAVVQGYVPGLAGYHETGEAAFYVPATDHLTVPPREAFDSMDEFYSTVFHEMTHSTGHASRDNRKQMNAFGSHEYGREELVAEMGASFLCAETGIESTFDNSAAYLGAWIEKIKEDPRAVVVAAGAAQKAVDKILGVTFESDD